VATSLYDESVTTVSNGTVAMRFRGPKYLQYTHNAADAMPSKATMSSKCVGDASRSGALAWVMGVSSTWTMR
jgi:hypothetical protein